MIDQKDLEILELLLENSRYSHREISRKTGIPIMTVLNRIKRLEREGVIKHYTTKIDHEKLGFSLISYVMVEVNYPLMQKLNMRNRDLAKKFTIYPFVSCVSNLAGGKDILLRVRARGVRELNRFIDKIGQIEGVQKTETFLVLNDVHRGAAHHKDLIRFIKDKQFADSLLRDE